MKKRSNMPLQAKPDGKHKEDSWRKMQFIWAMTSLQNTMKLLIQYQNHSLKSLHMSFTPQYHITRTSNASFSEQRSCFHLHYLNVMSCLNALWAFISFGLVIISQLVIYFQSPAQLPRVRVESCSYLQTSQVKLNMSVVHSAEVIVLFSKCITL